MTEGSTRGIGELNGARDFAKDISNAGAEKTIIADQ
jgi:hypothetical protein